MKPRILVSACLLGEPCRFDSASKPCKAVLSLSERFELIPVCPEVSGGLPTPRLPCEILNGNVIRSDGEDMTTAYKTGARVALEMAKSNQVICAILKNKSPSCGTICYDGTFTRTLTKKPGVTTALLYENGIRVFSENDVEESPEFKAFIQEKR